MRARACVRERARRGGGRGEGETGTHLLAYHSKYTSCIHLSRNRYQQLSRENAESSVRTPLSLSLSLSLSLRPAAPLPHFPCFVVVSHAMCYSHFLSVVCSLFPCLAYASLTDAETQPYFEQASVMERLAFMSTDSQAPLSPSLSLSCPPLDLLLPRPEHIPCSLQLHFAPALLSLSLALLSTYFCPAQSISRARCNHISLPHSPFCNAHKLSDVYEN